MGINFQKFTNPPTGERHIFFEVLPIHKASIRKHRDFSYLRSDGSGQRRVLIPRITHGLQHLFVANLFISFCCRPVVVSKDARLKIKTSNGAAYNVYGAGCRVVSSELQETNNGADKHTRRVIFGDRPRLLVRTVVHFVSAGGKQNTPTPASLSIVLKFMVVAQVSVFFGKWENTSAGAWQPLN